MSITVKTYHSTRERLDASIRYNKGSAAPELIISMDGSTVYHNTYMSKAGCRRAMNRFATDWKED